MILPGFVYLFNYCLNVFCYYITIQKIIIPKWKEIPNLWFPSEFKVVFHFVQKKCYCCKNKQGFTLYEITVYIIIDEKCDTFTELINGILQRGLDN